MKLLVFFVHLFILMLMLYTQRFRSVSKVSAVATIIAVNHKSNTSQSDHRMHSQQLTGTLNIRMIAVLLSVCMDGQTASRPFPVAWRGGALPGDCYAVAVCIWFFVEITRPHIRITVEICDEPTIPAVDNARYEIHRFVSENATKIPPSLRQNFSVPGYVNVTYTCDQGYRLQDPNNNMIGCEYVTTPRKFSNGSIHETVVAEAVWKSAEGIIC